MKKTRKTPVTGYTDIKNLAVSWLPGTNNKISTPNELASLDWGIINKKNKTNVNNVFAIYLDNYTGFVFVYLAESRGQASGPSLQAFMQRYGTPKTIIHDNAQEFVGGMVGWSLTCVVLRVQDDWPGSCIGRESVW